jgi:hypothetical protein
MIEIVIDPTADDLFDLRKIEDHAAAVEGGGFQHNHRPPVVPVQVPAFALVIEQPMPVTEIDFTSNAKHG